MLIVLYVISATLEIIGIALVVLDVRSDRRKARAVVETCHGRCTAAGDPG